MSYSSCQFWKHNSVFLQILHPSSMSLDIIPLYFFKLKFCILSTKGAYQSTNLVKRHVSSQKSEILHFDGFLLSKSYKVSAKKVKKSYLSGHLRVMQSLKKNWLVVSNMTWRIWWIFTQLLKNLKISFRWVFLSKVYQVWATKIQNSYLSWHWAVMQNLNKPWPCGFKNSMRNWVNSLEHSKVWKTVLW